MGIGGAIGLQRRAVLSRRGGVTDVREAGGFVDLMDESVAHKEDLKDGEARKILKRCIRAGVGLVMKGCVRYIQ